MKKSELKEIIRKSLKEEMGSFPKFQWLSTMDYNIQYDVIPKLKPNEKLLVDYGNGNLEFLNYETYKFYNNEDVASRQEVESFMIILI